MRDVEEHASKLRVWFLGFSYFLHIINSILLKKILLFLWNITGFEVKIGVIGGVILQWLKFWSFHRRIESPRTSVWGWIYAMYVQIALPLSCIGIFGSFFCRHFTLDRGRITNSIVKRIQSLGDPACDWHFKRFSFNPLFRVSIYMLVFPMLPPGFTILAPTDTTYFQYITILVLVIWHFNLLNFLI